MRAFQRSRRRHFGSTLCKFRLTVLIFFFCLASRFVEVIGQRAYVGTAIAIGGTLQLLSPLASKLHPMALATVTLIEGLCYGPVWPALYSLLAVWAPWHELSSMTSTMVAGNPGTMGINHLFSELMGR